MTEIKDSEGRLCHKIVRKGDIPKGRINVCPDEQFIQCATLRLEKGTTFRMHKHNWHYHTEDRLAQESWVVLKGAVKLFLYDTKGILIHTDIIEAGEASFTFEGFHNYEIMTDDSLIFEYKTGKYVNVEHDKTFFNDNI